MRVHFVGVGGIAMSAVAGLAKEMGFEVSGSEINPIYPPASLVLKDLGIEVQKSEERNIELFDPHLVVVGNAVKRDNGEVLRARALGKEILSFPQFIERFLLKEKVSLVVAGTHGKTTTTALLASSLLSLSEDPTFIIGGLLKDTEKNFRYGRGNFVVLEGDEYPSAFFDPEAKFLHYHPYGLILTGLEYDHADVFPDFESLRLVFQRLMSSLNSEGILVYSADDPSLRELIECREVSVKRKLSFGMDRGEYRLVSSTTLLAEEGFLTEAIVVDRAGKAFKLRHRLPGHYNSLNALAVLVLLEALGYQRERILEALLGFSGVKRRQEILHRSKNYLVIDDFAHHPSAVRVTLASLKETFRPEITTLIFEPRTNSSKRKVFQEAYIEALGLADEVFLKEPPGLEAIPENERVSLPLIAEKLKKKGSRAQIFKDSEDFNPTIYSGKRQLIVFMSSAYMGKEIEGLLELLRRNYGG